MIRSVLWSFLASASIPTATFGLTLDCSLSPADSAGGWVTDRYVFEYDLQSGEAFVSDAVTVDYTGGPVTAKISDDSTKKLVFTRRILTESATGQQVNMAYRAAYFKSNKTISVRAVPGGFANHFEARGTCKEL